MDSDFTLIFVVGRCGSGSKLTMNECRQKNIPFILVVLGTATMETPDRVAYALKSRGVRTLNVAGSRETNPPTVGPLVEKFLAEVFRLLL